MWSCRVLCAIANVIFAIMSLSAAGLLIMPTQFHRAKDAMTIRVDWSNLLCKTPRPNLDITDVDIYNYWKLPKEVRLSPRMIDAGRCGVAVAEHNSIHCLNKIHPTVCYCADIWWVPVMAVMTLGCVVMSLLNAANLLKNRNQPLKPDNSRLLTRCEVIRCVLYALAILAYTINSSNDFSYVNYGDLFPSDYLNIKPTSWIAAEWLFFGGHMGQSCCFIFLICSTCGCKKSDETLVASKKSAFAYVASKSPTTRIVDKDVEMNLQPESNRESSKTNVADADHASNRESMRVTDGQSQFSPVALTRWESETVLGSESSSPSASSSVFDVMYDPESSSEGRGEKEETKPEAGNTEEPGPKQKQDVDEGKGVEETVVGEQKLEEKGRKDNGVAKEIE